MPGTATFFELPETHVPEATRRQAALWTAAAARELELPPVRIRWFSRADRLQRIPWQKGLDIFEAPPNTAGMTHPQDGPDVIRLRADLAPTLAPQELAHFCAHEVRHLSGHARGKAWQDPAEEAACEVFAERFVARLARAERAGIGGLGGNVATKSMDVRSPTDQDSGATQMPNAGFSSINGRPVLGADAEARQRAKTKAWLQAQVGPTPAPPASSAATFAAILQAAALARSEAEVGAALSAWEAGVEQKALSGTEAELALAFLQTAADRVWRAKSAALAELAPPPVRPASKYASKPAPGGVPGIEYSSPLPIGRLW